MFPAIGVFVFPLGDDNGSEPVIHICISVEILEIKHNLPLGVDTLPLGSDCGSTNFFVKNFHYFVSLICKYCCMKICAICQSQIPSWVVIDGKRKNLQRRKYCLTCSPFGLHNTAKLNVPLEIRGRGRIRKKGDTYKYQKERGLKRKTKLVKLYGGCCKICGYKKNLGVLQFHHRDPKEKISQLDVRIITNRTWQFCLDEAKKCDLLCANCHAEHHYPELSKWAGSESNRQS